MMKSLRDAGFQRKSHDVPCSFLIAIENLFGIFVSGGREVTDENSFEILEFDRIKPKNKIFYSKICEKSIFLVTLVASSGPFTDLLSDYGYVMYV